MDHHDGLQSRLREAVDDDSWAIIALIGACWAEYPGCIMDLHGECRELLAPATHFRSLDGALWVVPEGAWTAACVGWRPLPAQPGTAELLKLYVARHRRRQGLGQALGMVVETRAREAGATALELWSDSRFTTAHRLYQQLGFEATGETRALADLSHTVEHHFRKELSVVAPSGTD